MAPTAADDIVLKETTPESKMYNTGDEKEGTSVQSWFARSSPLCRMRSGPSLNLDASIFFYFYPGEELGVDYLERNYALTLDLEHHERK